MNAEPERDPPKAFQRPSPGELPNAFKPKAPPDSPRVPTAAASPFAFAPPPTFDEPLGLPPLGSESGEEVVVERRRPQFNRVFALLLLAAVGSPLYGCCLCCGLAPFSSSPLFVTGTPNLYNPVLMIAWFGMTGVLAVVPGWAAIWLGLSQLLPRTQSSEWTRPVTTFFEPQSVPALLAFVLV
ncbi:MAG TPA: hypothetical protein VGE52_21695, partial [Pirellulales bacterium]